MLDVGCGRGAASFTLAHEHPHTQVTGVDLLAENVEVARTLYASTPNLTYLEGDATKLDLPDASFDRVLCLEAAFQFPDRARFLAEARRVLRPGGRVIVIDFMVDEDADPGLWESDAAEVVRGTWQFERFDSLRRVPRQCNRGRARRGRGARLDGPRDPAHADALRHRGVAGTQRLGSARPDAANPMLRSLTETDWRDFDRAAKAHRMLRAQLDGTSRSCWHPPLRRDDGPAHGRDRVPRSSPPL